MAVKMISLSYSELSLCEEYGLVFVHPDIGDRRP